MKEKVLKVLKLVCLVIASFNALMFYSMRPCWSGISKALGYEKGYNSFILYLPIKKLVQFFLGISPNKTICRQCIGALENLYCIFSPATKVTIYLTV